MLDAMHQDASQLSWFEDVLAAARTAGLHVIAATHVHPAQGYKPDDPGVEYHGMTDIPGSTFDVYRFIHNDSKYTVSSENSPFPTYLGIDYAATVTDFQQAGGYFACWLHGHTHYDICASVITEEGAVPQLDLGVDNAGIKFSNSRKERKDGTKTQDDFNIVSIDTYSRLVKVVGVGATTDYWMQQRETMCWNYETGELVHG